MYVCVCMVCMYMRQYASQAEIIFTVSLLPHSHSVLDRGDWVRAGVVASHMMMSPLAMYPHFKVTHEGSSYELKFQRASSLVKDKEIEGVKGTTDGVRGSVRGGVSVGRVMNSVPGGGVVTGFSRDLYLRLPKHFQYRIFALREQYLAEQRALAATSTLTSSAEGNRDQQA